MSTTLDRIVAVSSENVEGLLGVIVSYTIGDMRVPREALEKAFKKYNISEEYLPKEIRAVDAFKKASKAIETTKKVFDEKGELVYQKTLLVRDLLYSPGMSVRKIVEEVRDVKSRKLLYDAEVGTLTFYKKTKELKVKITKEEYNHLEELIHKKYDEYLNHYDGHRIRYIIRQFLKDRDPILVRPHGGTYFIPKEYKNDVERLGDMVNELASKYAVSLWETIYLVTPFIDVAKNRELLKLRWDLYVKNRCLEIYETISNLQEKGKYTEEVAKQFEDEINQLIKTTEQYETILQRQLTETKDIIGKLKASGTATQFAEIAQKLRRLLHPNVEET